MGVHENGGNYQHPRPTSITVWSILILFHGALAVIVSISGIFLAASSWLSPILQTDVRYHEALGVMRVIIVIFSVQGVIAGFRLVILGTGLFLLQSRTRRTCMGHFYPIWAAAATISIAINLAMWVVGVDPRILSFVLPYSLTPALFVLESMAAIFAFLLCLTYPNLLYFWLRRPDVAAAFDPPTTDDRVSYGVRWP
ncbi:MAG: hypothetical protein HY706_16340 [Candidatus Hydrogenedentes bacterium]|nr:hypothetical protein [Candidatus Hydrogenedentota bacterium]